MKPGTYCSEAQAASIMEMSVEEFRLRLERDQRSPTGFAMGPEGERHFVTAMIHNYAASVRARYAAR